MSIELGVENASGTDGVAVIRSENYLFWTDEDEQFCPFAHASFDGRGVLYVEQTERRLNGTILDDAVEKVDVTELAREVGRGRLRVDPSRRVELTDAPVANDRDAIGERGPSATICALNVSSSLLRTATLTFGLAFSKLDTRASVVWTCWPLYRVMVTLFP